MPYDDIYVREWQPASDSDKAVDQPFRLIIPDLIYAQILDHSRIDDENDGT